MFWRQDLICEMGMRSHVHLPQRLDDGRSSERIGLAHGLGVKVDDKDVEPVKVVLEQERATPKDWQTDPEDDCNDGEKRSQGL